MIKAYSVYVGKILLPISPEKIQTTYENKNKNFTSVSGNELNIPNLPGAETISFSALLPNVEYSYGNYLNGFQKGHFYANYLYLLKANKTPFPLIISRYDLTSYFSLLCLLEELSFDESRDNGIDIVANLTFKKFNNVKLQKITKKGKIITTAIFPIDYNSDVGGSYVVKFDGEPMVKVITDKDPSLLQNPEKLREKMEEICKKNNLSWKEWTNLPAGTKIQL